MKVITAILVALWIDVFLQFGASAAADTSCPAASAGLYSGQACHFTHATLVDTVRSTAGTTQYRVQIVCLSDAAAGLCNNPRTCPTPPGSVLYDVYASTDGTTFEFVGDVCLQAGQAQDLGAQRITIDMIEKAFQRLDWPASPLTVQPPNGRTLVNLATNFSTTNTQATTQSVTLLGHTIDIEATPVNWHWDFGDGTTRTTTTPGATYPDLQITHAYTTAHTTVHPDVATTYHGRYRVDGGQWNDIPVQRTIPGTPVDLQILQARPILVAPTS